MKLGISIKIDVTKIDKSRIFQGQKGKYLDLTTFIDTDNPGQYGDHGFISQSVSKEEKEQGVQTPILGNTKVFWGLDQSQPNRNQNPPQSQRNQGGNQGFINSVMKPKPEDEIPF